jgi:hypothetical protein
MNALKTLVLSGALVCVSLAASANSIDYENSGGTLTATNDETVLTLTGSILTSVTGGACTPTCAGNLGKIKFTTGVLTSGSLATGATFGVGGFFMITGNGSDGVNNGILFQGTFTSATWTPHWNPTGDDHGYWTYELSATISGTLGSGQRLSEKFIAFTFDVPHGQQFSSAVRFKQGVTSTGVPEPGTLALVGIGMVSLAGSFRRKLWPRV